MWRSKQRPTGPGEEHIFPGVDGESLHSAWIVAAAVGAALMVPLLVAAYLATYIIMVAAVIGIPFLFLIGAAIVKLGRLLAVRREIPTEEPLPSTEPAVPDQEPALATVSTIGDPYAHAMVFIADAVGLCPRGLRVGQVLSIDKGRASVPLCIPAVIAVKTGLERLKASAALAETEVACDCPIPGRSIVFCVERSNGAQSGPPVSTPRAA